MCGIVVKTNDLQRLTRIDRKEKIVDRLLIPFLAYDVFVVYAMKQFRVVISELIMSASLEKLTIRSYLAGI